MPKIELHVHLEGTIGAEHAARLARRHGHDPDEVLLLEAGGYPPAYTDFAHFLRTFLATSAQVRTPDDLAEVAGAFAAGQAEQRIAYTEVTFTAATHVAAGMEPGPMWAALRDGLTAGGDSEVVLIVDVIRDAGPAEARTTLELVEAADAPIVGLGLTGTEGSVPEREFTLLRRGADQLGLGLSVHAGESGTPANVRAAVEELGADRIGHGVASISDHELTAGLARAGIPLEVCPSSNVALGVAPSLARHPLPALRDAGIEIVIGSDDPAFFHTTLTDELGHAQRLLGAGPDLPAELQLAAARAAFAPAATRAALTTAIESWRDGAA